jgi:hypothetical protein
VTLLQKVGGPAGTAVGGVEPGGTGAASAVDENDGLGIARAASADGRELLDVELVGSDVAAGRGGDRAAADVEEVAVVGGLAGGALCAHGVLALAADAGGGGREAPGGGRDDLREMHHIGREGGVSIKGEGVGGGKEEENRNEETASTDNICLTAAGERAGLGCSSDGEKERNAGGCWERREGGGGGGWAIVLFFIQVRACNV